MTAEKELEEMQENPKVYSKVLQCDQPARKRSAVDDYPTGGRNGGGGGGPKEELDLSLGCQSLTD